MRENINLVNKRGDDIEHMDATARNLGKSSYEFRKTAQRSKLQQQFRKWKWTLLIALIVIILIIAIAVGGIYVPSTPSASNSDRVLVTHGTRK